MALRRRFRSVRLQSSSGPSREDSLCREEAEGDFRRGARIHWRLKTRPISRWAHQGGSGGERDAIRPAVRVGRRKPYGNWPTIETDGHCRSPHDDHDPNEHSSAAREHEAPGGDVRRTDPGVGRGVLSSPSDRRAQATSGGYSGGSCQRDSGGRNATEARPLSRSLVEYDPRTEPELRKIPARIQREIDRRLDYLSASLFRSHPGIQVKPAAGVHGVWHFHIGKDVRV